MKKTLSLLLVLAGAAAPFVGGCYAADSDHEPDFNEFNPDAGADGGDTACVPSTPCAIAYQDENGLCVEELVPGCSTCTMPDGHTGTTRDQGACCLGCWAGPTCRTGDDEYACGVGGVLCDPCDGTEICHASGVCSREAP